MEGQRLGWLFGGHRQRQHRHLQRRWARLAQRRQEQDWAQPEGLYGLTRNNVIVMPPDPTIPAAELPQVVEEQTTTAAFFKGLIRYDRFFTPNNTGFLTFYGGLDIPASKEYFLGGQVGYARQILKTKMHEIFGELGYDFTFDRLNTPATMMGMMAMPFEPNVFLHSGRLFFGYVLDRRSQPLRLNAETLLNFNPLTIGDRAVGVAEATRVNAKAEFTTKIWKPLSFAAAFSLRYNNAPAVNAKIPAPSTTPLPPEARHPDRARSGRELHLTLGAAGRAYRLCGILGASSDSNASVRPHCPCCVFLAPPPPAAVLFLLVGTLGALGGAFMGFGRVCAVSQSGLRRRRPPSEICGFDAGAGSGPYPRQRPGCPSSRRARDRVSDAGTDAGMASALTEVCIEVCDVGEHRVAGALITHRAAAPTPLRATSAVGELGVYAAPLPFPDDVIAGGAPKVSSAGLPAAGQPGRLADG